MNQAFFVYFYYVRYYIYGILLFLFFAIEGCKKNDDILPEVEISSPLAMIHFSYGDIISIDGLASDNIELARVEIKLLSQDQNSTYHSHQIEMNSTEGVIDYSFLLDDKHMPSGNYFIKASAFDKSNNKKSIFIEIQFTELPLELEDVYLVEKGIGEYSLHRLDANATEFVRSFIGDFQDVKVNSYWGQLYLSGGTSGNLFSWDVRNAVSNWEKNPLNTTEPYFSQMYWDDQDKSIAVSRADASLVSFDKEGVIRKTYSFLPNVKAGEVLRSGEYLFVEEVGISQSKLGVYYASTGVKSHEFLYTGNIVSLLPLDNDKIGVVLQQGNQSRLLEYYPETNTTYEPHSIASGQIFDAVTYSSNEIHLLHSDGVLRFTFDNNSLVTVSSIVGSQIEYDHLYDVLYVLSGNSIQKMDRFGNLGQSSYHSSTINKFVLYYNK